MSTPTTLQEMLLEKGCILIKEYIQKYEGKRNRSMIHYKCKCGKNDTKRLDKYLKSPGYCSECNIIISREKIKHPFDDVIKCFDDNNCELLSTKEDYITSRSLLKFRCSCGNIDYISYSQFKSGSRCKICKTELTKNTNIKRYGVEYPIQLEEFKAKQRNTMYKNNSAPSSKQQNHINDILNGELNYPVGHCSLDIAFPNEKIYIEYDGSGHELQVVFKSITKDEYINKERKRKYFLKKNGWQEIKIISRKDKLTSDHMLINMIDFAKEYLLTGHSWITFDIDNGTVSYANFIGEYNFGLLFNTIHSLRKDLLGGVAI